MIRTSHEFLGDEVACSGPPRACVVPVPIELSTSYIKGTGKAPAALLNASRQIESYNPSVDIDLKGAGIVTLDGGLETKNELIDFISSNRETLASVFTCFLGGEHSITPWILEAMDYGEIGIVWLDAHADLRREYLGDTESHACAARNSLSFGNIVEIGVRSYSIDEKRFIDESDDVEVFNRWGIDAKHAVEKLPARVYLSLDFDGIDPSVIRAVGTPEPGGLNWDDLIDILSWLFSMKTVVGMDAVELCPVPNDDASDFIAARAVYEAISRALAVEVK
ncbi:MAG: arginase family protein [Bacteroidales bacterium]|nr:arginase family protein [Candidatus Latescibacterota bacterium]